ncbi:helix-turn-helix domain-containing protein [Oscillospiraceae bacterium 50-16]|nr:helix-turn-helix transcriptional regulator [Lawsonibacter sp.]
MEDYRAVLRDRRKKLGWSQYRLAKELGISQSFINEIESGKKSPSLDVFFRICEALKIQIRFEESE